MKTRPLEQTDYDNVVSVMHGCGLCCSVEYMRHNIPRGVVLEDAGRIIGFCGVIPVEIWSGTEALEAYQLGMLGMESGHGSAFLDLLEGVRGAVSGKLVYANTANKKGAKIWTGFYGMRFGPKENAIIRYRPIIPFMGFCTTDRVEVGERWQNFINALRAGNRGVMTARSVAGWQRLRATCVTVCEGGRILGAAFVRCRPFSRLRLRRFDIVDICAVNNDERVLLALLRKCCRIASMRGGLVLEYVGAPTGRNELFDEVLKWQRPAVSNTFVYDGWDNLDFSSGWFFGPYDGDRCIS